MIVLKSTTETLELTSSSTADLDVSVSVADITTTTFSPTTTETKISSATTTTIMSAPAASTQRQIKIISIRNVHATDPNTISVKKDISGTEYKLTAEITLEAGEMYQYIDGAGWIYYTNAGVVKTGTAGGGNTGYLSAAGGTLSLGTAVFSNSNGVSFGVNGQTLTASHNGLTTARASNDAIGLNTAQTNVTWTVNSAGISFNAGAYLTTAMLSNAATISNINVSAGTTSQNLSNVVFSNSNGVSFGLNGSTVTASVAAGGRVTVSQRWQWPPGNLTAVAAMGNGSLSINRIQQYVDMTATRMDVPFLLSILSSATANTWGFQVTVIGAIYTKNVSTLSSLSSASTNFSFSVASNSAGQTQMLGNLIRPLSVPLNVNMTPGEYYVAFGISTNTSSAGTATTALGNTWSVMGGPIYSSAVGQVGEFTATSNTSTGLFGGQGVYSAAISTIPPTISLSAINQTGSYYARGNMGIIFRNI
jgi:hypothetical protein